MKNERQNAGHCFGPSLCKPCRRKEPRSKLFQKSREQLRRTREYFRLSVPNRKNNANARDVDVAEEAHQRSSRTYDSSNTINVKDQCNVVAQKMWQIPSEEPSNARVAPQPNDLKRPPSLRPNYGSSRLNNGVVPSQKNIEMSRPSFARLNNAVFPRQGNTKRSRLSSLRSSNDMVSPQRNTKRYRPSSLRPSNDMVSLWRSIERSRSSSLGQSNDMVSSRRNTERSRPSSSRFNNGLVSSRRNLERSRLSFSRSNTDIVLAQKNAEKSKLSFSRLNTQKNTESRLFSSRLNRGLVTLRKNIEKFRPSRFKDGFSSGKLDKLHSVGSKDNSNLKLGILKEAYPSPAVHNSSNIKQTVSSKVHNEDIWMAKEAPNPILEGNQVMQDFQSGNTSSPMFGKDLSSHQTDKELCMGANMQQNGESLDGCIELDSRNQNTSFAEDDRTDDDKFKSKRKEPLWEDKLETGEDNERVEAENRRSTKRRRRYIAIEDEEDGGDQNVVCVECGSEEAENCRMSKKRRRYIANEDEEDGGDQNPAGVEGAIAGLTTEAATEVPEPFVSDSVKLQHYSFLPIDEPVWSGILKVGSKEYVSLAAHLSAKCCAKVWKLSRSLQQVVEVTKLSRLEAWPKSFEASSPTNDNIALYFLPHDMRPNEDLDQLVKEVMENDMVFRAVVGEAEMLIFPSVLLPEQHQTFRKKPYLWGVFKRREDKDTIVDEHGMGRRAQDKEMGKQPASHCAVGKDGYRAADLNIDLGLEAPVEVERQGMEQELTPSLARPNAPHFAGSAARPTSAPTAAAAMPTNHGQIHSSVGVSSGAVFGFVVQQTPRVKELIQEMERAGAVVVVMRGEVIASGLGQPIATG